MLEQFSSLTDLADSWTSLQEDLYSWAIVAETPHQESLERLFLLQNQGLVPRVSLSCGGESMLDFIPATTVDIERAQEYWERAQPSTMHALKEATLKISAVVAHQRGPRRLALRVTELCNLCHTSGIGLMVHVLIDKRRIVPAQSSLSSWTLSVWFQEKAFFDWLKSLSLGESLAFLGSFPPPLVILPRPVSGAPKWITTPELLEGCPLQAVEELGNVLAQRREKRLAELTARSNGPLILLEIFSSADPTWIAMTPPFAVALAYAVLTQLSSDFRLQGNQVFLTFRYKDHTLSGFLDVASDQLRHGEYCYTPTPTDVASWYRFLVNYKRTTDEAHRHIAVWRAAIHRHLEEPISGISLLTSLQDMDNSFRALRETLLDENLERALTAAEKAENLVGQLAGQVQKDVDAVGSDAERLAVAGISSGLVGVAGAIFKSDGLAAVGPIATALVFLWYFPLMFGRIRYLDESIRRREDDLLQAINSLRRYAGDLLSADTYTRRFEPHRAAAQTAIDDVKGHLLTTFFALNLVATAVTTYITWVEASPWTTYGAVGAVLVYVVGALGNKNLPKWLKIALVSSLVLVLAVFAWRSR